MGAFAWKAIEEKYPDTEIWETETPYFEQRNIHFYMNICGFHAVEFFHPGHQQKENHPDHLPEGTESEYPVPERSFKFEKRMTPHLFHRS